MNAESKHKPSLLLVICVVSLIGIIAGLMPRIWHVADARGKRAACVNTLSAIGSVIRLYAQDNDDRLPNSFQDFAPSYVGSAFVFICPATQSQAGSISNVNDWTSYTYVKGLRLTDPGKSILAYCPPSNHQGKWGCILHLDGSVSTHPATEFQQIVKEGKRPQHPLSRVTQAQKAPMEENE